MTNIFGCFQQNEEYPRTFVPKPTGPLQLVTEESRKKLEALKVDIQRRVVEVCNWVLM